MGFADSTRQTAVPVQTAVPLPTAEPKPEAPRRAPIDVPSGAGTFILATMLIAFWLGAAGAYGWGYFGPAGLFSAPIHIIALALVALLAPPALILVSAWAFTRGQALASATSAMVEATDRLFAADEITSRTAARLGRTVRRELDALNAGLDGAFTRLRALESVLEAQISALDEASARADVRTEAAATRLTHERERIENISSSLAETASHASELVAGRAAQLKTLIESADGTLKAAGQLLETQAASFRTAAQAAAEAPHSAAAELEKHAKQIEAISDTAMGRAEFLLGRHEKHRAAMQDIVQRLREEGGVLETALTQQRHALEQSIGALSGQAKVFETMATETERQLESIMSTGAGRATELAANFAREANRVKETCEVANGILGKLVNALHDAGTGAQALVGETAAQAQANARALVGGAMAECQNLMRAAAELTERSDAVKQMLAGSVSEIHQHLLSLPAVAQQEAARVREVVRAETDEILNVSARTLSAIHARSGARPAQGQQPGQPVSEEQSEGEGLLGLARKLTQRPRKKETAAPEAKPWEMSTLLSAVDSGETKPRELKPAAAAALGALEAALADLAVDLSALTLDGAPANEDWRAYLAGDRSVFARRIANAIDDTAVERIATLNRENTRFREAANTYLTEFETLLERARHGDNGGLLASTLLSADTGKIYLAIAYALGRLSR